MQMPSMPEDAFSHTVIVRCVLFEISPDIIAELLRITWVPKTSTMVEQTHDVGTFSSSTNPINPQAEGDDGDDNDQLGDFHHENNFFVFTGRHRKDLDMRNTFS